MFSRRILAPLVVALSLAAIATWAQAAPSGPSTAPTADSAAAANQAGLEQMRARDLKGAIASFSSAIALAPNSAVYLNNRSLAYLAYGNAHLALADSARARKVASRDPDFRRKPAPPLITLAKAPAGAPSSLPMRDNDADQAARIGLTAPKTRGQTVVRPANFDPGVWTRGQYDGLGRDMSMTNAMQSRVVAAYQEQRAAGLAEQARNSPEQ